MTSFVFIFSRTHAQTRTRVARYATAEAAEPACSFTDLLVPLRTRTSIINNQIYFFMNPIKQKTFEVRWDGEGGGGGIPHRALRTPHNRLRAAEPEPEPDSASKSIIPNYIDELSKSPDQI